MSTRSYGRLSFEASNEDKVLFPDPGLTKGDLIDYYERIAEHILPYLEDRPLVVQRFPDGIEKEGFYQKQAGDYFPDWIATARVDVRGSDGAQELVVCDNKATLAYLANQACVTLHPWLSRRDRIDHPDLLVIDLDPPEGEFEAARKTALRVRALFQELGLSAFPKLTGSKGVHVAVALDRRADFDSVREFARAAMELLASRHPDELTTEQRKDKRRGRVYLDTGRNAYGQTAVAPWSVRALPGAPVAAPITWKDLGRKRLGPRDYRVKNAFRSLSQRPDPWADLPPRGHGLGQARKYLDRLYEEA